jgi:hypothetical protein
LSKSSPTELDLTSANTGHTALPDPPRANVVPEEHMTIQPAGAHSDLFRAGLVRNQPCRLSTRCAVALLDKEPIGIAGAHEIVDVSVGVCGPVLAIFVALIFEGCRA